MRVYVGQCRGHRLVARLGALGFGECTQPNEFPPRRRPWFFDNGAFKAWRAGKAFNARAFLRVVRKIERLPRAQRPDFIVLPDIVGGGLASLALSRRWMGRLYGVVPLYLAVQDGMEPHRIAPVLRGLAGIFVGGTLEWKLATGERWATFAKSAGIGCHIGRCGGASRVKWAKRIGATSLDSSLPLFSEENLARFIAAVGCKQMELLT